MHESLLIDVWSRPEAHVRTGDPLLKPCAWTVVKMPAVRQYQVSIEAARLNHQPDQVALTQVFGGWRPDRAEGRCFTFAYVIGTR
jgi:hypothetical protein